MKKTFLSIFICTILILAGCSNSQTTTKQAPAPAVVSETEDKDYGNADFLAEEGKSLNNAEENASLSGENNSDDLADSNPERKPDLADTKENGKNQKLVYTCNMTIESLEYEKTVKSIKGQIQKYQGIIQEENESDSNAYWYNSTKTSASRHLYLIIRIPADQYEAFLKDLDGNGKITSKNMKVDNITKHYSEVETTIKSLKTQEKRLLEMMEKATSIEDMIAVESRLTEVQNQLAQYKNTLSSLDTDVSYSTINLSIDEVVKYDAPTTTFGQRLSRTLGESKENFLSFLENSLFFLILFGPVLLVLFILLFLLVKIVKAIRKKKGHPRKKLKRSSALYKKGENEKNE